MTSLFTEESQKLRTRRPRVVLPVADTRTGSGVCVQGINDHHNVRGSQLELYGSQVTLLML